jgi:ABC-type Na+ efflux pump permease subunit
MFAKLLGVLIVIFAGLGLWLALSKTGLFNKVGKKAKKEKENLKKKFKEEE